MDDNYVTTPHDEPEEGKGTKVWIIILVITIVLILVGGISFYFGRTSQKAPDEEKLTTTPALTPTPSPNENPFGEPTITAKPTVVATPTTSPTPTPTPPLKTKTLSSTASLDGFMSSNGGGNLTLEVRAGRNEFLVSRGFVSFDLGNLPTKFTVQKATLRLYQAEVIGSPYQVGGNLMLDHLDYGNDLTNSDYQLAALTSSLATLSNNTNLEWKEADVTEAVKNDVEAARTRSQFRIHFTTEVKGGSTSGDFAYFESADNNKNTGKTPQLIIKYF